MKKRRQMQIRTFRCPVCGATQQATKVKGRTSNGHIKTMYCTVCRADKQFVQTEAEIVRV